MNKKQMKKEQERLKRERKQVMELNDTNDVKKVLFISLGVVAFIGIVFVAINIFNGTWNIFTRENTPISDQGENRVMCGTMFEIEEPEYLVLAYDFSADDAFVYETYIGTYNMFAGIYSLDLNSALNNSCVGFLSHSKPFTESVSILKLPLSCLFNPYGGSVSTKSTHLSGNCFRIFMQSSHSILFLICSMSSIILLISFTLYVYTNI